MRTVYRVLAYAVAVEVAVQAMAIVYGVAGLSKWIEDGGVFDKSVMESGESPFPEEIGLSLHFFNGTMVVPLLALALLIVSFFAGIRGGAKWAGLVLLLVVVQVTLGFVAFVLPAVGSLHGLNALLLFSAAVVAARRERDVAARPAAEPATHLVTTD
jgi:amino acid transporter